MYLLRLHNKLSAAGRLLPALLPFLLAGLFLCLSTGAPAQETPAVPPPPTEVLRQDTTAAAEKGTPAQGPTGRREDVNEFLGYEALNLERYLSLPYDTFMNINMNAYFVEIGFLLLLLLPLAFLFKKGNAWWVNLAFMALSLLVLLLSAPSAYVNRNKIAPEAAPDSLVQQLAATSFDETPLLAADLALKQPLVAQYPALHAWMSGLSGDRDGVTYPVLLLLFLLLFALTEHRIRALPPVQAAAVGFLLVYAFLWWVLSSGITWYGLLMVPLALVYIVRGAVGAADWSTPGGKVRQGVVLALAAVWVAMAFTYRFANYEPTNEVKAKLPFMASVSEYQIGRQDEAYLLDKIFQQYEPATRAINMDDRSLVYRVGTFMPFFVEKNDKRVFSDNFLDFFRQLHEKYPDKVTLARLLRAYGFQYFIVDLNLPVNDNTPEQTLKAKYVDFMNFLYRNPQIELVTTDRRIRENGTGEVVNAVFPNIGQVEYAGWFAVFRIR